MQRGGRAVRLGAVGGLILFLYGVLPTSRPAAATFGRVYGAYGGVFMALSLEWGWWIDGVRPTRWALLGGTIALLGVGASGTRRAADIGVKRRGAQWQRALPVSVKALGPRDSIPASTGTNSQSYPLGRSVRASTPKVSALRRSLVGSGWPNG